MPVSRSNRYVIDSPGDNNELCKIDTNIPESQLVSSNVNTGKINKYLK